MKLKQILKLFLGAGILGISVFILAPTNSALAVSTIGGKCNTNPDCETPLVCDGGTLTCIYDNGTGGVGITSDPRYIECMGKVSDAGYCQANYLNYIGAKCEARQVPCSNSCDPYTGQCLTQSGGAQPAKGVKGSPCIGDSDCGQGWNCDMTKTPHTCQVPTSSEPPVPGTTPTPAQPAVTVPNLTGPTCNPGPDNNRCPTGLCWVNGLCLPPSSSSGGIAASSSLTDFILKLVQILLSFAGMIAVVMLVLGGYWYMAAGGNEEMAEKGTKTLTNFAIGLVVIIMAYTIVTVVASTLTGTDKLLTK